MLNADFRQHLVIKYTLKVFSWSLVLTIRLIYLDTSFSSKGREETVNLLAGEKILIVNSLSPLLSFAVLVALETSVESAFFPVLFQFETWHKGTAFGFQLTSRDATVSISVPIPSEELRAQLVDSIAYFICAAVSMSCPEFRYSAMCDFMGAALRSQAPFRPCGSEKSIREI